jgi:hypothetical protein
MECGLSAAHFLFYDTLPDTRIFNALNHSTT